MRILFHTAEDRLGDALIKLPALMAARAARPDMHLTWSAGTGNSLYARALAPLAAGLIDVVHERSGLGTRWGELLKPRWKTSFDVIIASERRLLPTLALKRLPHQRFIAPMGNFRWSDARPDLDYRALSVAAQTTVLLELALQAAPLTLPEKLDLPADDAALARELLPPGTPIVGLSPGAGGKDKCWPREHFAALAREQLVSGRRVAFFLGPEEAGWQAALAAAVPGAIFPEHDAPPARQGPLLTMALGRQLAVAVANDSGAGHLLAASGCPLIILYGRTNPRKFTPGFGRRHALAAAETGGQTVADIPFARVSAALEQILG